MTTPHFSRRTALLALGAAVAAVVLVACGGGGSEGNSGQDAAVQEAERMQAQGLLDKLPVSWSLSTLKFSLNPGSRQNVPVTLTTTKALTNAKIVFVPDLRNAVTVSPDTIPSLAAGKSATVTLSFAPKAGDPRKAIAGILLLFDKNATTSRPLLVDVSLVKAETINGVVVPPEPPQDLNNATLAGFDVNGNGVRDDVERFVAKNWPSRYADGLTVSRQTQMLLLQSGKSIDPDLQKTSFCILALNKVDGSTLIPQILNTVARYQAYGRNAGIQRVYGCDK